MQIDFFIVKRFSGVAQGKEGQLARWVDAKDINNYQFPEANQTIINKLAQLI